MVKPMAFAAASALIGACTSSSVPDEIEPTGTNFDVQIDGQRALEEPVDSEDLHLCAGGAGQVYVAWRDAREGFSDVWFNRSSDDGATWLDEPVRAKQGPGDASGLSLTCDGDRVYIAWEDDRDGEIGYTNIYLNRSSDGGQTWMPEDLALDDDPEGIAISLGPTLALRGDAVYAVWYDQREGAPDIYMAASSDGGASFGPPRLISSPGPGDPEEYWSGNPEITLDDDGRIYIVWEDTRAGGQDIWVAVSDVGGTAFLANQRIDTGDEPGAGDSFFPRIGVSGSHAYVVWHDTRAGEGRDIFLNYSSDSGVTWLDAAIRLEDDPAGFSESIRPELVVEGSVAHVVWQDERNVGFDIYYRRVDAGVPEPSDRRIETDLPGEFNSAAPRMVLADDQLVVAWSEYRHDIGAGYNDLFYSHAPLSDTTTGWAEADLRLDSSIPGTSFTTPVEIAVQQGMVLATWIDGRSGSSDVFFSSTALGSAVDTLASYEGLVVDTDVSDDTDGAQTP